MGGLVSMMMIVEAPAPSLPAASVALATMVCCWLAARVETIENAPPVAGSPAGFGLDVGARTIAAR
jgi:hypothetical protein